MLKKVDTSGIGLSRYEDLIPASLFEEIERLADKIEGKKVAHINATAQGGGVAEVLGSLIPLQSSVGLDAEWYAMKGEDKFFDISKNIHNGLQGEGRDLTESEKKFYLEHNKKVAASINKLDVDYLILHDPQPTACVKHLKHPKKVCRVHIDTTSPRKQVRDFIFPFFDSYDRIIFSMDEFVPSEFDSKKVKIAAPAIDPFTDKNDSMDKSEAREILSDLGIDPNRPFISQVSRFDPWKDPVGVLKAYKKAKKEISGLQFGYAGLILADDDPEAQEIYEKTKAAAGEDEDIHLFEDPQILDDHNLSVDEFVNAFQAGSDLILQKSIREGFALTVTEAMWKGKLVIGGKAGGIKKQIKHDETGFLVNSVGECHKKIVEAFENREKREELGKKAKKRAAKKFLQPRLLRDHLETLVEIDEESKK